MVRVWNVQTGQQLERLKGHKDSVYSVAFSPDGKCLVSGSLDRTLRVWDLSQTKRVVESVPPGSKEMLDKGLGTCASTLNGHKVSLAICAGKLTSRITFFRSPFLPTGSGSSLAPRTAPSSSGTSRAAKHSLCSRATRTASSRSTLHGQATSWPRARATAKRVSGAIMRRNSPVVAAGWKKKT